MELTEKLGLKKPSFTNYINIFDLNENMDILDAEVGALKEGTTEVAGLETIDKTYKGAVNELNAKIGAHEADYEYQVPSIVDRQIRLIKQSNTNILKFKLNTDIVEGTQLTISIDGGSTSKPLEDFEGVAITELEKGFVEVIADATFFTLRPRGVSLKVNSAFFETFYGVTASRITFVTQDDDYVYVSYDNPFSKVIKIRKSDKVVVGETSSYGDSVNFILSDGEFIYIGGGAMSGTGKTVWKVRKSDMVKVGESLTSGGIIKTLAMDDEYVYVSMGSNSASTLSKIRKSDMVKVGESEIIGTSGVLSVESDYLLTTSSTVAVKVRKSDMIKVTQSATISNGVQSMDSDLNHMYIGSNTNTITKLNVSNLIKVGESGNYGSQIHVILSDGGNLLIAPGNVNHFLVIKKDDFSVISRSAEYPSRVTSISLNDKGTVYSNYNSGGIIRSSKVPFDTYLYKNLTLSIMEER